MKELLLKTLSLILALLMMLSVLVFSESEPFENSIIDIDEIIEKIKNGNTDLSYSEFYERDSEDRVTKKTTRFNGEEIIVEYHYDSQGNATETKTVNNCSVVNDSENQDYSLPESNVDISPMSAVDLGNISSYDDDYLKDPTIIAKIKGYKDLWNEAENKPEDQKNFIREIARINANLIRADYVVAAPFSDYAIKVLGGTKENPLSRVLKTTLSDTKCFDVMVIQRALILHGYIEPDDIVDEEFGYYGDLTYSAVYAYQDAKKISKDGEVYNGTYHSLFGYASSDNNVRNKYNDSTITSFGNLNLFRLKHNFVKNHLAAAMRVGGSTVLTEKRVYYPTAYQDGYDDPKYKLGSYGVADIVRKGYTNRVWEVKAYTDDVYTRTLYRAQVNGYAAASKFKINTENEKRKDYCPFSTIYESHAEYNLPYSPNETISYWTCEAPNVGLVFYTSHDTRKNQEQEQEAFADQTAPETSKVREYFSAKNVLTGVVIVGAVAIIIISIPSGGWGFAALAFAL